MPKQPLHPVSLPARGRKASHSVGAAALTRASASACPGSLRTNVSPLSSPGSRGHGSEASLSAWPLLISFSSVREELSLLIALNV